MASKASIKAPAIGERLDVYGRACKVVRVYAFGTCDVVSLCGAFAWRVSGLGWVRP